MQISLHQLMHKKSSCGSVDVTFCMNQLASDVSELFDLQPFRICLDVNLLELGVYQIDAHQVTVASFSCARCLEHFHREVASDWSKCFSEKLISDRDRLGDLEIVLVETGQVELEPYIRESFLLAIPYVPLCDPECKGLCPSCGTNRNRIDCSCELLAVDPRLTKLGQWQHKGN